MLDFLMSLVPGGYGLLLTIGAAFIALFATWMKGRSSGINAERQKQTAGKLVAAEDRLEMDREATEAEKQAGELSDDEARGEAMKWSRP